ncbi:MAG: 50S ribosomal protein L9 [Chlamydiia bacterium]|nr:50S ribosomal protein L9 [Chlamydiia bacterium]
MGSKLLLIQDVDDLGRTGEVVEVKHGYARNFLVPRGFAVVADRQTLRMQQRLKEERAKQAAVDRKDSEELAKKLNGMTLSTVVKVDQEGHMFGSVSQMDIVHLLEVEGYQVAKKMVRLQHPIKSTGVHHIELKLKEDVPAEIILKVVPDHVPEHLQAAAPSEEPAKEEA